MPPLSLSGYLEMKTGKKRQGFSTKTRLSYNDASDAFSLIWDFDFDVFGFGQNEYLSSIYLSKRYGITLYDASYIELAQRLKCRFITADRKLYEKVKGISGIELL